MFLRRSNRSSGLLARTAMGIALVIGVAGGAVVASAPAVAKSGAAPLKLSPGFQKLAVDAQKAVDAAKGGGAAEIAAARTSLDAASGAIANNDDKFMWGNLAIGLGGAANDPALQRRGIDSMLQSGKVAPADQGKFNFFSGQLAYQARDYAAARTALQEAIRLGYRENDPEIMLAESYFADNQAGVGLDLLLKTLEARRAAGQLAPQTWYGRGLGVAFKAKMLDQASRYAIALARDYPSTQNWAGAITVVREVGKFGDQEILDLQRLMDSTNSYSERNDYLEYVQTADPRRLPGEALRILDKGVASGKVNANDAFVVEARSTASGRLAADKASLAGLERDARGSNAALATLSGAGDAFLSYDDPVKAEQFYTLALAKPGADAGRILTRLGIAQMKQGKYADAQATFAKVTGPRKPIADLWALHAAQKANPAAAGAAAVSPAAPK